MKRKYYPNNWEAIKACPPHYFPPMEYEEFTEWKIHGYVLPSSVFGVIRSQDPETGKVEEYTYQTKHHARQRLDKEIKKNKKIVLATMDGVYHLQPHPPIDFIWSMNEQTFNRRYDQLVTLINIHPYKSELLNIMQQQLDDDSVILDTE